MPFFPSRKVGTAFLGVFVIGAVAGGLLVWTFQDMRLSKFMAHTGDPVSMAARINQKYIAEYHLSADEQARIAPLTQEMARRLYVIRRQFGVDIIATLADYHRRIGEQMTPEHRQAFEKANEEREKRMSALLLLDSSAPAGAGSR